MAVITISKIQVRRGRKHEGIGIPQLSSGELGWALDAKELYIGNGSVSEGAPAVGNTRILTEHDLVGNEFVDPVAPGSEIFDLDNSYVLRVNDLIQTSDDPVHPTVRTVQERLDDFATVLAFGAVGDGATDCTNSIQRAVDELFLNHPGYAHTELIFPAGEYVISQAIQLPPHARLRGHGSVVIRQNVSGEMVFRTVNNAGDLPDVSDTTNTQCHSLQLNNLILQGVDDAPIMLLMNCRDSRIDSVSFVGNWSNGDVIDTMSSGIILAVIGSGSTSNNQFTQCKFSNLSNAVRSEHYVNQNTWSNCIFDNIATGFIFGETLSLDQINSPTDNQITHCQFTNINQYAVWINSGNYNRIMSNSFMNVGNNQQGDLNQYYSVVISMSPNTNVYHNTYSRMRLVDNDGSSTLSEFIPPVNGSGITESYHTNAVTLPHTSNPTGFIRLPYSDSISYTVHYRIDGVAYSGVRIGVLSVIEHDGTVHLSDDYKYHGDLVHETRITFAQTLDISSNQILISINTIDPALHSSTITYRIDSYTRHV